MVLCNNDPGLDIVVLGSNIGIESSFFALTHPDVQVYGYDLLCAFVDRARELQVRGYSMTSVVECDVNRGVIELPSLFNSGAV